MKQPIALTLGDPAGIGPDIALQCLREDTLLSNTEIVIFGSAALLKARANTLNISPDYLKRCQIVDIPLPCDVTPGQPDTRYATSVIHALSEAIEACQQAQCDALVTGPIHKALLNEAGISFSGHTEFLAEKTHTDTVVMSFFSPAIRLGLFTTHLPLSAVPAAIESQPLARKLTLFSQALERHLKRRPHIGVLGLNPHAGENGYLGREEIEVITPTLNQLNAAGFSFSGPLSADSAFAPAIRSQYDALFAMYHDQGLCGLKAIDFGDSVNVTLGLPFIRTSVDHGTAFDKAGTHLANPHSLIQAIKMAHLLIS